MTNDTPNPRAQYARTQRIRLRKAGICPSCAVNPAPAGSACDACRDLARSRQRVIRAARAFLVQP